MHTHNALTNAGWTQLTSTVYEREGYTLLIKCVASGRAVCIDPINRRRNVRLPV